MARPPPVDRMVIKLPSSIRPAAGTITGTGPDMLCNPLFVPGEAAPIKMTGTKKITSQSGPFQREEECLTMIGSLRCRHRPAHDQQIGDRSDRHDQGRSAAATETDQQCPEQQDLVPPTCNGRSDDQ